MEPRSATIARMVFESVVTGIVWAAGWACLDLLMGQLVDPQFIVVGGVAATATLIEKVCARCT
jgi:hypothetical protein